MGTIEVSGKIITLATDSDSVIFKVRILVALLINPDGEIHRGYFFMWRFSF